MSFRERRRRVEAAPPQVIVHDGLRVDVAALARALVAIHRVRDAEQLLADPPTHLARAVLRFDAAAPGLLGVTCERCGVEYPTFRVDETSNGFAIMREARCPVGHALCSYTVYV